MKLQQRRIYSPLALLILLMFVAGGWESCHDKQPRTVADALSSLGNIKRGLKKKGEITAQQDLDISRKLDSANRAYRKFVTEEQARVAGGTSDPTARGAALSELRSILTGLDASAVGIKNPKSAEIWNESVGTLNTILAGLGG